MFLIFFMDKCKSLINFPSRESVIKTFYTMTKLRRDEPVAMLVLEKICATLDTDFGDIVEYIREDSSDHGENQ